MVRTLRLQLLNFLASMTLMVVNGSVTIEHTKTSCYRKMSSTQASTPPNYEATPGSKLWEKTKAQPFVPIGIAGMLGTVIYGAMTYRKKGKMSTSIFLMHLRVRAQGVIVGAMTLGVTYALLKDFYWDKKDKKDQ